MNTTVVPTTDHRACADPVARCRVSTVIFLASVLVIAGSTPSPASQPIDAQQALEELTAAMKGSAATTRRRALEDFRQNFDGKIVRFSGTLWTLSSLELDRDVDDRRNMGPAMYSWEFQGIQAKGDHPPAAEAPTDRAKIRLGGADHATLIIVRSGKYQLYALTASPEVVDGLKQGAEVSLEVQVSGLLEESLFGFITAVLGDQSTPRCVNGHELPAGNDFKYCPYCGEPLT